MDESTARSQLAYECIRMEGRFDTISYSENDGFHKSRPWDIPSKDLMYIS